MRLTIPADLSDLTDFVVQARAVLAAVEGQSASVPRQYVGGVALDFREPVVQAPSQLSAAITSWSQLDPLPAPVPPPHGSSGSRRRAYRAAVRRRDEALTVRRRRLEADVDRLQGLFDGLEVAVAAAPVVSHPGTTTTKPASLRWY